MSNILHVNLTVQTGIDVELSIMFHFNHTFANLIRVLNSLLSLQNSAAFVRNRIGNFNSLCKLIERRYSNPSDTSFICIANTFYYFDGLLHTHIKKTRL